MQLNLSEQDIDLIIKELNLREMYYQRQGDAFDYMVKTISDLRSRIYDQIEEQS